MGIAKPVINSYREVERLPEFGTMTQVAAPQSFTVAVRDEPGNLNGTYYYSCTFVTARGETEPTSELNRPGASPVNQMVDVTLPAIPAGQGIIARKVYRNYQSSSFMYETQLVGTVNDPIATVFTDNVAEGSEGAFALQENTTGGFIQRVNGTKVAQADQGGTHFGYGAGGETNYGLHNTNFGYLAGNKQKNTYWNTNVGAYAGELTEDGFETVNIGYRAGGEHVVANYHVNVGPYAGSKNKTGTSYVNIGYAAGGRATADSSSVNIGYEAGGQNLLGTENVTIGRQAGAYLADGTTPMTSIDNCVYIGDSARGSADGADDEIVIGAKAIGKGDNTITLGKSTNYLTQFYGRVYVEQALSDPVTEVARYYTDGKIGSRGKQMGLYFLGQPTDQDSLFFTGAITTGFTGSGYGTERFTFQSPVSGTLADTMTLQNGRVGIGTATPGYKLDVDGTVRLLNLPTANPSVAGQLWNNAGVLTVSAG